MQRAKADVWLPQGEWFDFFDGRHYTSRPAEGRRMEAWRDLDRMPVFAKPGAIVPLQMPAEGEALNSVANPRALQVVVFPGAENSFTLWEDDGAAQSKDRWASTEMALRFEGDSAQFSIAPAEGHVPWHRSGSDARRPRDRRRLCRRSGSRVRCGNAEPDRHAA